MEEVIITLNHNLEQCLLEIKKYLRKDQRYFLRLQVKGKNKKEEQTLKEIITAFNEKDIEKRYRYIYDRVCSYLDRIFKEQNICDFQNNRCIAVRTRHYCESEKGCCYGQKRGTCKYLKNHTCSIKSLSCKLFTCKYLRKRKKKFLIREIPLLNLFFNYKQKYIISYSIFIDEDEMIKKLLKARGILNH